MVGPGSVKIIKPIFQETVHHSGDLVKIDPVINGGKTHTSEAKILLDLRKEGIHSKPPVFFFYHSGKGRKSKAECPAVALADSRPAGDGRGFRSIGPEYF